MSKRAIGLVFALAMVATALPAASAPPEHCVIEVVDQKADGEFITSKPVCFRGQADAVAFATDGRVVLRPGQSVEGLVANRGLQSMSGLFAIGIHYDGFNGTGSSITVMGSTCGGGWWNTSASWDNRISSSYNGCQRLTHHDYPNKGGSSQSTTGAGTTDNLSTLNNRAESVSYWSS